MLRTVAAHLNSNMSKALLDLGTHAFFQLLHVSSARVTVAIHGEPTFPADQLVDWLAAALALDVPQSHVQPAQRVVQDRTISPIGTRIGILPEIFDVVGVASAGEWIQEILNRRNYGTRALR